MPVITAGRGAVNFNLARKSRSSKKICTKTQFESWAWPWIWASTCIWNVRFVLQIDLGGLQGDDKTIFYHVDVNRWIISADNLLHHSFSSCFAFNVDGGVRSIIVSVKGRRRGTKNQLRPQICITATIYPVQSIVNCDLIIKIKMKQNQIHLSSKYSSLN